MRIFFFILFFVVFVLNSLQAGVLIDGEEEFSEGERGSFSLPSIAVTSLYYKILNRPFRQISMDETVETARKAVESTPNNPFHLSRLGNLLLSVNLVDEGAENLWKAAKLNPNNTTALADFGFALLASGDPENGKKVFKKVLFLDPTAESARINLAIASHQSGDSIAAIDILESLLDEGVISGTALYNLSVVFFESKRWARAEKILRQALVQKPNHPVLLSLLVRSLQNQGNFEAYLRYLSALEEATGKESAQKLLAQSQVPVFLAK